MLEHFRFMSSGIICSSMCQTNKNVCLTFSGHNYIKDLALVLSLVLALGGCWLAYVQHKYSQNHIRKVMRELEALQKAEDNLTNLQEKYVYFVTNSSVCCVLHHVHVPAVQLE